MRFAVQQLIAGIPPVNRVSYAIECVAEEFAVGTGKLWSLLWVVNLLCPSGDSIGDVWCRQIDLAQAGMDPDECVRIVGRRDISHLLVGGSSSPTGLSVSARRRATSASNCKPSFHACGAIRARTSQGMRRTAMRSEL